MGKKKRQSAARKARQGSSLSADQHSVRSHAKTPEKPSPEKASKPVISSAKTAGPRFSPSRRLVLRSSVGAVLLGVGGWALHHYDQTSKERHNLSVIGQGSPVVVQVHDPACGLCRRLMSATELAMEDFPDVRYRIADITEDAGRAFQAEHEVAHVTLLLFNGRGRLVDTVNGVQTPEYLRAVFAAAFEPPVAMS